ncbi:ABC transporter ATP-binding protein [Thiomicrorhabdus heinhorstiae]|uniref:ATP-binding cassette domain-containing protein n=1 Tax=Thiomicrorhabdus heinhorstiae TaxID=2748010 RepID=A0ABS0C0D8_9GAMM|nr:ATP-binding cassette domain-containing protein [Thiomicrorhabdus heinhorstiae]MBF6058551.1 ATP-binding cassette domain-containing protein [Thiomicrorhabdus heinhorstiae]
MIEAKNLFKYYGKQSVLEKMNVTIRQGEFITMVGPSGCGKSTFLKMILGTEKPSQGKLLLNGKSFPNEPSAEIGVVFQQYSVFSHLTVLDNLLIVGRFKRNKTLGFFAKGQKRPFVEKALALLEKVGLDNVLDKYPHELSGGMAQRLAIAQALLGEPKILLLDEPFGALDPGTRKDMHKLVLELWKELGITIVMVTHDLKEGFYLGTRLWVFDKANHYSVNKNQGSTLIYDLPIGNNEPELYRELDNRIHPVESFIISQSAK